jgi:alanine racemase
MNDPVGNEQRRRMAMKLNRRKFISLAAAGTALTLPRNEITPGFTLPTEERSGPWLEIDLGAVAWNLARLRERVKGRPVMGVIKCNAYGHGLVGVGKFLEGQGIAALAVASATEALALRDYGVRCPILNFGPFSAGEARALAAAGVAQSVYSERFKDYAEAAAAAGVTARVHVKIDTGLGRLGVPYYLAMPLIRAIAADKRVAIEGVFTALTEDDEFDREQLRRFLEVCNAAKAEGIQLGLRHVASSAGVFSFPEAHLEMVRPGIALYGHYPSEKTRLERSIELRPAMQLKAPVLYVKRLRPGDGVSYHRPFVAEHEVNVATVGLGYSDDCPQEIVGRASVLIRGRLRPLVAAVTSNHITANLELADDVKECDEAVIFGRQGTKEIGAEEVAGIAGVSVYRLLMQMNPLLPRRYVGG